MYILYCILIGYGLGCINPAAFISYIKKHDLKNEGTGNFGATNVTMVVGRGFGAFVMLFDIFKGAMAVLLCRVLFEESFAYAAILGGLFAIVGHVFPFYLKFRGGKGLAAFGGLVLGYDPLMFLALLALALAAMFITNYSFVMPFVGGGLFCILVSVKQLVLYHNFDIWLFLLALASGLLIMWKHTPNFFKARENKEIKVRDYIKKHILKKED